MRRWIVHLSLALGVLLLTLPVKAEENLDLRIKALEEKMNTLEGQESGEGKLLENVKISGFVDASFVYDDNAETNTFGLDQFELDIEKSVSDRTSLRAVSNVSQMGSQMGSTNGVSTNANANANGVKSAFDSCGIKCYSLSHGTSTQNRVSWCQVPCDEPGKKGRKDTYTAIL